MRFITLLLLLPFLLRSALADNLQPLPKLILCGGKVVSVISVEEPDKPVWSWKASDSPELPEELHGAFATTDECKPYTENLLLITASSGGVALVERGTKVCRFWGRVRNVHSACLLPGGWIAVASSFGGDEVVFFRLDQHGGDPVIRLPLVGAHGVHWEADRKILWALGDTELLYYSWSQPDGAEERPELKVVKRWPLPSKGGHDLSPLSGGAGFFITTDTHVYRFHFESERFELDPAIGEAKKVKSVDQVSAKMPLVYQQADEGRWWSCDIRFVPARAALHLESEVIYKIRWDVEAPVPGGGPNQ